MSKIICTSLFVFSILVSADAMGETKNLGYVVHMFHPATYSHPDNCPEGLNESVPEFESRILKSLGYSEEEVQHLMEAGVERRVRRREIVLFRGRKDGQLVNALAHPTTVPEPETKLVRGQFAYGFNLNGVIEPSSRSFTDPETRQSGVDNELFRVLGCWPSFDLSLPNRPSTSEVLFDLVRDSVPAWLFVISDRNPTADGADEVYVRFYRATQHPQRDRNGRVMANATYLTDLSGRSYGEFRGILKDGVLTVDSADLLLEGEPPIIHELDLSQAQFRLDLRGSSPDNQTVTGWIGGYIPWMSIWFEYAHAPGRYLDAVALYYALERRADADPDPKTGHNTRISATFRIEATPAFVADHNGTVLGGVGPRNLMGDATVRAMAPPP